MKKLIAHINNKLFNINLEFFIKNSGYNLLSYFIGAACTLAMTYIIANNVSDHHTGVYRYIFSWYGTISAFMLAGISSALTISIAKGFHSLKKALVYKAWFSLLGVGMSIIFALYYFTHGNIELFWGFILLAVSMPILEISGIYTSYLQGKEDFKGSSKFSIVNKIISLLSIIVFIFVLHISNSYILIISNIGVIGLTQVFYIYKTHTYAKHLSTETDENDTYLLRNAVHFSLVGIAFALGQQADKLILFKYFGTTALATYWIATTLPLEAQRLLSQISSIYIPKMVKLDIVSTEFKKRFLRIIIICTGLMIPTILLYYVSAPYLFALLFPKYMNAVPLSQVFFASILFVPATFVWSFFVAKTHMKKIYFFHIGDPLVQILCYILFVYIFPLGILGIIYAVLLKGLIMSGVGIWLFMRGQKIQVGLL